MALPMQPGAPFGQAATIAATMAAPAAIPTQRGGYAAPVSRPAEVGGETINLDDFYLNMEQVPPAALGGQPPPPPQQPGAEWTPAERPIIRPQSAGGTSAPLVRRAPAQVQSSPRPADELGVEESEFDKPTYLRRGLAAPE
jgi:pyocin large subunit-like protein